MTTHKKYQQGNALLWLLGLIALAVLAYFIFRDKPRDAVVPAGQVAAGDAIVIEGEVVCLPHRDTSGPTTMECAYGLKDDKGEHYALDGSGDANKEPYETGERIAVEGTLVPEADIPNNMMTTYNIVGMVKVTDHWEYRDK